MGTPAVALKPRELSIALLDEIHDAFNTRDADQIMAYFHPDTTFYPALGPEPVGRTVHGWEAVHKFLADRFKKIFEVICGIDATPADGQIKSLQAKLAEMQVKYDAAEKAFSEKKAEAKKPYSDPEDEAVNKHSRKAKS